MFAAAVVIILPLLVFLLIILSSGVFTNSIPGESEKQHDDSILGEGVYHTVIFCDVNGNAIASYSVMHGEKLPEVPEYAPDGYIFNGWSYPLYAGLDISEMPDFEDITITPVLLDQNLIALNGIAIAGMDASSVDINVVEETIEHVNQEAHKNE